MGNNALFLENVLHVYNKKVIDFEELKSGSSNKSWIVKTSDGRFVLKQYSSNLTQDFIKYQEEINSYLNLKFESYVSLEKNIYEKYFTIYSNSYWTLKEYIDGRCYEFGNTEDIIVSSTKLSELHTILVPDKVPLNEDCTLCNLWTSQHIKNFDEISNIVNEHYNSYDAKKMINIFNSTYIQIKKSKICEKIRELPLAISHGDYHGNNIILNNDNIKIIDWDMSCLQPRVIDISIALYMLSRKEHGKFEIINDQIKQFLRVYNLKSTITQNELNLVKLILKLFFLPRIENIKSFNEDISKIKWYLEWSLDAINGLNKFNLQS